jgi:hypothetical protein
MSDTIEKPGPRPAAAYAAIYPILVEAVRPLGYALTLHGSMNRDMDLVAVPWVEDAAKPELVAETIREQLDGFTGWDNEPGKLRPHGRRGWLIWFNGTKDVPLGGGACVDLSIMPRHSAVEA